MSEYKEQLIELFENVSGCEIQEFGSDQLPFLADYIIGQQEADNACIEKLKSELKTERDHNERLTAIATKHATRADELYEALETVILVLEGKTEFHPDEISTESVRSVLDKSRIEAEEE